MSVATEATPARPVLKRSLSDLEDRKSTPTSAQPPAKRPKVQFGDNKVFELKSWNDEKTISLVKGEVRTAIEKHLVRENAQYDNLREILTWQVNKKDAPSSTLLKRYVIALTGLSGLMGKHCAGLVDSITDMQWLGRDEEFVNLYRRLLASVVSAHGGYAHDVLASLVEKFAHMKPWAGMLPDHETVTREELLERVHGTIQHILYKYPAAVGTLKVVLQQNYPHASDNLRRHASFAKHALHIGTYAPQIKADIAGLVMERLAAIDAQTQADLDDLQEQCASMLDQDLLEEVEVMIKKEADPVETVEEPNFDSSDDEDEDVDEDEDETGDLSSADRHRLQKIKNELAKMDAVMDALFSYYDPTFGKSGITEQENTLDQLIGMLTRIMLPTFRSRHIQFILFRFAQTSPELSERFVQALIDILLAKNQPAMFKRSAAAYLASFIARASTVDRDLTHYTFYILSKEMNRLRDMHERNVACGPDLQRFGTYYTIFQSLMYIFCFRWRDLLAEEVDDHDLNIPDLTWSRDVIDAFRRNVYTKLNPLKVCAPGIVSQFAMIAHQLQILMLEPLIQSNARIRLTRSMFAVGDGFSILAEREKSMSGGTDDGVQLDAYFPFDPYRLPTSKHWVNSLYNDWRGVPGFEDAYESDDESIQGEDEDELEADAYDEPTETESLHSRAA